MICFAQGKVRLTMRKWFDLHFLIDIGGDASLIFKKIGSSY